MHELSVCFALMNQVEDIARERHARRVESVLLRIGPLSGVEPDLLRSAFPIAAAGTLAEGARLDIETGSVVVRCSQCGGESEVPPNRLICGHCGDFRTRLVSGDEMTLQSLELETAASAAAPAAPDPRTAG